MISIERYVCSVIYDAAMCGCLSVESFWDHPKKTGWVGSLPTHSSHGRTASGEFHRLCLAFDWAVANCGSAKTAQSCVVVCRRKRVFFCAQVTCKIAQRIPLGMDVPKNDEIDRLVAKMREIISNLGMPLFSKKPFLAVSPKQYHHVSPVGQSVPLKWQGMMIHPWFW